MTIIVVDPPSSASGTTLIFDLDSFSMARLYKSGSDCDHPSFTIRSEKNSKHRYLHVGSAPDGVIAGEVVLHGRFKKGLGTVSVRGATPIPIEGWMNVNKEKGFTVRFRDLPYTWSKRAGEYKQGDLDQNVFDATRNGEVIAAWYASHGHQPFSPDAAPQPKTIVRAHLVIADGVDMDNTVPELILSLMAVNILRLREMHSDRTPLAWAAGFICVGI